MVTFLLSLIQLLLSTKSNSQVFIMPTILTKELYKIDNTILTEEFYKKKDRPNTI